MPGYVLAVLAVAAAYLVRLELTAWIGPGLPTFIVFYPAVMIVSLVGGIGPGLLATVFAALVTDFWLYEPVGTLTIAQPVERMALSLFMAMGVLMAAVAHLFNTSRQTIFDYQRELAVRESDARYRSLFEASLDAIFSLDAEGRFATANPSALRLAGLRLEELNTHHFLDLCAPDQRETVAAAFRAALCRQCLTLETAMIAGDGSRRELYISGAPTTVDGEVVGVSCIARDVTELKKAQELLSLPWPQARRASAQWRIRPRY